MKILIVDDDAPFRDFLSSTIREKFQTSEIQEAEDGESGLARFKTSKFDVIIVDMNMPKMGGIALAEIIREYDRYVPIILVSNLSVAIRSFNSEIVKKGIDFVYPKDSSLFLPKILEQLYGFKLLMERALER